MIFIAMIVKHITAVKFFLEQTKLICYQILQKSFLKEHIQIKYIRKN